MKPRFDHAELIRQIRMNPIDEYMFTVDHNGKTFTVRGDTIKQHLYRLEHYEASKVMEQWYWAKWYKMPITRFLHGYAEALVKTGSIMVGILNFDINLEKYKNDR